MLPCPRRCATAIGESPAAIAWLVIVCRRSWGRRPVISARLQTSAKCRLRTLLRSRSAPSGEVKTKGDPCPSASAATLPRPSASRARPVTTRFRRLDFVFQGTDGDVPVDLSGLLTHAKLS